jgi:hypothetical protein
VLASTGGWGSAQTLMVIALVLLLALIVVPGLVAQNLRRRSDGPDQINE